MSYCLPKSLSVEFKRKLKSGEIDPKKLSEMTSAERNAFFASFLGEENAKSVNALFESKLLLKNKVKGMVTWAKTISGIKPQVRTGLIERIKKMDKILNPEEEKAFLKDLASKKMGVEITPEEAKNIFELSNKIDEAKKVMESGGDRFEHGRAVVEMNNYIGQLKEEAGKIPLSELIKNPIKDLEAVGGFAKSIKASFDDSAIFRQGWKSLFTHPGIWRKNAVQSIVNLVNTFGKKPVMDELQADLVSRPNAVNGLYKMAKLDVGNVEEYFSSTLPEKVPVLGRMYKASEVAFTAFQYKQRADIFDRYITIAEKQGLDLESEKEVRSIGRIVNSLTGRGDLGKAEPAANFFNNIFFSPRKIKADIDTLTLHATDANFSGFARKQAAINLVRIITGIAAILGTAKAIKNNSVETDPRSSDFGKIKIGDTRFDVTGGMASLVTLAARLLTVSSKSSTTKKVTKLNSGKFGSQTGTDVFYNYLENKLSPASSVVKDLLKGQDFNYNKPTIAGEASNLFMPLPITNYQELKTSKNSANMILALFADFFGISTNTYTPTKKK